ncbi:hypothetical protein DFJ74DRAFT_733353 [Hyaloraphidium curvatum]|nr:hypothetical protein DFJ74DRAFT_733353 [Hyaloraphidium curvatum]
MDERYLEAAAATLAATNPKHMELAELNRERPLDFGPLIRAASGQGFLSLKLDGTRVARDDLAKFLRRSDAVKSLVLRRVGPDTSAFEATADSAPPSLQKLTIDLEDQRSLVAGLSDSHLMGIAERVRSLKIMELISCHELSDLAVRPAVAKYDQLVGLDLSYCQDLTDAAVGSIASRCLEFLKLDGLESVSDTSVTAVLGGNHQLRSVGLQFIDDLDPVIPTLAQSTPTLEDVKLSGATWDGLWSLIRQPCPNLRRLYIDFAGGINDETLPQIADVCPKLEVLKIGNAEISNIETLFRLVYLLRATLVKIRIPEEPLWSAEFAEALEALSPDGKLSVEYPDWI